MATTCTREGGGSFGDLRRRHLPLFDESVRRHDRGWPHGESGKAAPEDPAPRRTWETRGIFHFRDREEDER